MIQNLKFLVVDSQKYKLKVLQIKQVENQYLKIDKRIKNALENPLNNM